MTSKERAKAGIIDGSRRIRIAKGSGTQVQDVNELLKKYMETKKMLKKFTKGGAKGLQRQLFNR
jgi:signal recognition particle subunit SRP54